MERYTIYTDTPEQREQLKKEIALAHSREDYPKSTRFWQVLHKALKYYNDNYVRKER